MVKSLFSAILVGNRKASLEARRHREEKKKYKCSVYFVHGNTVAKKTLRFLGEGNSQPFDRAQGRGEERFFILLFLFELLQEGLREF